MTPCRSTARIASGNKSNNWKPSSLNGLALATTPPHGQAARGLLEAVGILRLVNARRADLAPFEMSRPHAPSRARPCHSRLRRHDTPASEADRPRRSNGDTTDGVSSSGTPRPCTVTHNEPHKYSSCRASVPEEPTASSPQDGQKLIRIPWHLPRIYPVAGSLV